MTESMQLGMMLSLRWTSNCPARIRRTATLTPVCIPDLANRINNENTEAVPAVPIAAPLLFLWVPNDAKICFIWLFPLPVSCLPSHLDRLDWRPIAYFCRTKQPTKENSWILASLVIFVLRYTPLSLQLKKKKIPNQISTYHQFRASNKVWGSVNSGLLGLTLFMFLSCVSSLSSTHGSVLQESDLGSSKPEENKQELSLIP